MNLYLKEGRIETEKNDCSVIALSYAFNIDYSYAHSYCKEHGRKDGHGYTLSKILKSKKRDYKILTVNNVKKKVIHFPRPNMTVKSFKKLYCEGIYIIRVSVGTNNHLFTMIDGVVFNNINDNKRIINYFYITNINEK